MIKWAGTIASIIGSFLVAGKILILGYCLFMIGSISWLVIGALTKDKPMIILNGFFLSANILGLYNAFAG